jgi:HPt (histidine-containing phosphotransfer) domain-containing protein
MPPAPPHPSLAILPGATVQTVRGVGCRVGVVFGILDDCNVPRRTQFAAMPIDTPVPPMHATAAPTSARARPGPVCVCDTPVIALCGRGPLRDEERFRELGFDDHLSTPFRRREPPAMLSKPSRPPGAAASADAAGAARGEPAGAAPAAEPVLDPAALARLAELDPSGSNRLLERVLLAFQASVTRLRPQLAAARSNDDRAAIRLVAHTLKSSSASIGALRLSQLCAQIETVIRLDSPDDLGGPLGEFDLALDRALQAIDALISKERT